MEWTYRITAEVRPRVLMRIAQMFEQQMVSMLACHMETVGNLLDIAVTVDVDPELAHRIHAKLWKQFDLRNLELFQSGGVKRPSIAVQPPSTMVSVPVTNEPASEAR